MVSENNFTFLVVSSTTPFFAVLAIIFDQECSLYIRLDPRMKEISPLFLKTVFYTNQFPVFTEKEIAWSACKCSLQLWVRGVMVSALFLSR